MNLEHKKRVISAVVGLVALLAIYFGFGHPGLIVIMVAISAASYYEFLQFSGAAGRSRALSLAAGTVLSIWLCVGLPGALEAVYVSALAVLLRGLWRVHQSGPDHIVSEVQHSQSRVFGLTYMVVFPSFVTRVHALPHGPALLFLLIGVIWLGDIGAYYGGKAFGRNKLSPSISPGKTREGALAGLVVCALWAAAWGSYSLGHLPVWKWILIAVLTSVVAQAGDLLESLLKRAYSVKDSGGLIPGHGGVFDRFDSLILAAPFFYLLLSIAT
ncbi:MAG: phosphatidate cytidylyltransferase [Bdellovibrionota bacterium]